jgi:L-lactate dehydrogenase (cytochrome)
VFDYVDGAAEAEVSLRRARRTLRDVEFHPSVLRDVGEVDLSTTVLGQRAAAPFLYAPTGFTRMMQHEGERAVARSAARTGIPYTLSTMGTTSIEDLAAAAPDGRNWFGLYVWKDRGASTELMARAKAAGYEALVITVDVPVGGARLRDNRNGFSIPPALSVRTVVDGALHPSWWLNFLTTEPLRFATLDSWQGTIEELAAHMFDPTVELADLAWVREHWDGPLVVKGVQTVADAERVVGAGADAVVLSNHGGRQLDRAPVPLTLVPDTVQAVGDRAEVYVDTGFSNGADVVAAVALGARAVMLGRAYLYGLMAGGERGVDRVGTILTTEIARTLRLLGVRSLAELTPEHVRLP